MRLNPSNKTEFTGHIRIKEENTQFLQFPNCYIRKGFASIPYFDFINEDFVGHFRFYRGATSDPPAKFY